MSRLVNRFVQVKMQGESPLTIVDKDSIRYTVSEVIDYWIESGAWWNGELSHHMYRVLTTDGSMFDLERQGEQWRVYRVFD